MAFGFLYKGITSQTMGLIVNNVNRDILPPIESREISIPGSPGSEYFGHKFGSRHIEIDFTINAADLSDIRAKVRDLADWLNPAEGPYPLILDDEPDKYVNAALVGTTDLDQIVTMGQGTLDFFIADPLSYATTSKSASLFNREASTAVHIEGTYRTYPIFTALFLESIPYFQISLGPKFVLINYPFKSGDELVIDHQRAVVLVNGLRVMTSIDLQSDFFGLEPGENTLSVNTPIAAEVTVEYRERWL